MTYWVGNANKGHCHFISCVFYACCIQPRCSKHNYAHTNQHPEPARRRGGGSGGRGGGGRRGTRGRSRHIGALASAPRIRRAALDRVASKLQAELKLQNADPDDTFDADADFHEDVLDAAESDVDVAAADASDDAARRANLLREAAGHAEGRV